MGLLGDLMRKTNYLIIYINGSDIPDGSDSLFKLNVFLLHDKKNKAGLMRNTVLKYAFVFC